MTPDVNVENPDQEKPTVSWYSAGTCWVKRGPPGPWTKDLEREREDRKWI